MIRTTRWFAAAGLIATLGLSACSFLGSSDRPKPTELGPMTPSLGVKQVWSTKVGEVNFGLDVRATDDNRVLLANSGGEVFALDARTGATVWQAALGERISAGVGGNAQLAAVVTRSNDVVAIAQGKVLWRFALHAQSYTAPLVAGGRVFVLGADRSVTALDGDTGRKLWTQARAGEPLVLSHAGVLLPVGDTLVVGVGSRLVGMNPLNGSSRWEASVASSRGTNEVERLVDLVGRVSRVGNSVCVRSFQAAVACVDAGKGSLSWSRPASGSEGVHGDDKSIFATETSGKVQAWRRSDGERLWDVSTFNFRGLSAPLVVGRSLVFGDHTGLVHVINKEDGKAMNRLTTDGSAITAAPVVAGNTVVVVTRNGGVFGFQPE